MTRNIINQRINAVYLKYFEYRGLKEDAPLNNKRGCQPDSEKSQNILPVYRS